MSEMRIKVMPFLQKRGNRVAQGSIEMPTGSILEGMDLFGFTICDDPEKGLFVLFPSSRIQYHNGENKLYYFLRPDNPSRIDVLESKILDVYESMVAFNRPRMSSKDKQKAIQSASNE